MERIIFFDGSCVLCNNFALLVFKNDKRHIFKFASLQSSKAREVLTAQDYSLDTVVYFENQKGYCYSTAVIKILLNLGGLYKILGFLMSLFPVRFRDLVYKKIAANRHRFAPAFPKCDLQNSEIMNYTLN
ncbi:MAG: thiol-disulfide oxidoreductase DCC family protein [Pseudobdellovibrio sp.]